MSDQLACSAILWHVVHTYFIYNNNFSIYQVILQNKGFIIYRRFILPLPLGFYGAVCQTQKTTTSESMDQNGESASQDTSMTQSPPNCDCSTVTGSSTQASGGASSQPASNDVFCTNKGTKIPNLCFLANSLSTTEGRYSRNVGGLSEP